MTNIGYLRDSVFRGPVIQVYGPLGFVSLFSPDSKEFKATKLASKKFAKAPSEAMMKCNYIKPDAKQKTLQSCLSGWVEGLKEDRSLGRVSLARKSAVPSCRPKHGQCRSTARKTSTVSQVDNE